MGLCREGSRLCLDAMQVYSIAELGAALFQATVTLGLAGLFFYLYRRHRKAHFFWWAMALSGYAVGLGAIGSFLITGRWAFLYWHQVIIGWTALGLLYAAQVFSRQLVWRRWYLGLLAFPVVWSFVAIFVLDQFALAAGPAVVFLSLTTAWTGIVFWRYRQRTGSPAAGFLAVTLLLWGVHHLDYPILRARGAWNPWGYYVDTLFILAMGGGVLLLVVEEFKAGLLTLTALSGDVRRPDATDSRDVLLRRPLGLRGVTGSALVMVDGSGVRVDGAVGACGDWLREGLPGWLGTLVQEAVVTGRSRLEGRPRPPVGSPPFAAVLPLGERAGDPAAVLVIVGDVAAPFAALDDSILAAVGEQVGAGLEHAELYRALAARTADLERLSARMITEHEEQRRRLGRELHDETAQVFSALKLQIGSLREAAPPPLGGRFDRLVELVDVGTRSIRNVTEDLRPAVLEDLGLVPALRAMIGDFGEWSGLRADFSAQLGADRWQPETELTLFRAVQEALSNVARHARDATRADVGLSRDGDWIALRITDDGIGLDATDRARLAAGPGRSGLFGLRERIWALGGTVEIGVSASGGVAMAIRVPAAREDG